MSSRRKRKCNFSTFGNIGVYLRKGYKKQKVIMKYVEKLGPNLADRLTKSDPWKVHCQREKCMMCNYQAGNCMKKVVCYEIVCKTCIQVGKRVSYFQNRRFTTRITYV